MAVIGEMDVFGINKDKQYEVVDRKSRQAIEKINKDVNNSNKDVTAGKVWKSTSEGAGWADSDSMSDNQSGGVDITIGGTKKTVAKQADLKEIEKSHNELKSEKVDNPPTGAVGQILEIETVDENGKPKTYKAVNKPIGAGEVTDEQISNAVDNYMAANPFTETDPTVPDWAKQPEKPSYTAEEVGADAAGTAESKVSAHNTATDAHNDIRLLVQGLTERLNALADSDDETLDKMSEIVSYIKYNRSLINGIDKIGRASCRERV